MLVTSKRCQKCPEEACALQFEGRGLQPIAAVVTFVENNVKREHQHLLYRII